MVDVHNFHCPSCKKKDFEILIVEGDDFEAEVVSCKKCGWEYARKQREW